MRILVTGANGQLGMSLRKVASVMPDAVQASHSFVFTDVTPGAEYLDITDLDAIKALVARDNINAVINCAAYTNVESAEDHPEMAELLNASAVRNLAIAMKEVDGLLVHISTDYVFGKEAYNVPCKEDQAGTPLGVYGLTKLHGEQAVWQVGCRHIIIRTAWLYSEYGKNFVKTILNLTEKIPEIKVVFDQVGTPTYAGDLARAILTILDKMPEQTGNTANIYHYSNEGVCSWYDFAKTIAEYAGQTGCEIVPCHSDEFPSKVRRPAYSVLDKTKIKESLGIGIPYWTDSLWKCINNLTEA